MKISLIPEPQYVRQRDGRFLLRKCQRLYLPRDADNAALRAARELTSLIGSLTGQACYVDSTHGQPPRRKPCVDVRLKQAGAAESYVMRIAPSRIVVEADGLPGLFYAIQTLKQLVRQKRTAIPCCVIRDKPALPNRGYYLDLSRGKIPKMETIERLIDRLASLKVNQFQLYVEHVFHFKFDPDIGDGFGSLTPEDVLRLDAYCRDRHIRFIPSVACFGHMGRIMSLPQYRSLAEVEWPSVSWQKATWRQRMHGATINPRDKRSQRLLANMLNEYLPLFRADQVNICGDETYDLGRGKNARLGKRHGVAKLYIDHLKFLRSVAKDHGKSLMFWGDVMLQHPQAIKQIPSDATVLDWAYYPQNKFEKVGNFTQAGLAAYVCPSVRGYERVFHDVEEARATIRDYAATGLRLGTTGLLNTDWGDMGHFNLLTVSLHGLAMGAAMAWNPAGNSGAAFDRAFALQVGGDRDGHLGRIYKNLGSTNIGSWKLFIEEYAHVDVPPVLLQGAKKAVPLIDKASSWLEAKEGTDLLNAHEWNELQMACRALRLNAEKIIVCHKLKSASRSQVKTAASRLTKLGKAFGAFEADYRKTWLRGNRPEGLSEVARVLRHMAKTAR